MEISSSNLNFRISMLDLDELKPHEEVIDSVVRSIANDILKQGKVRDPLVVEQEEHVVLDGMHRYNSLKLLKTRFAPCCIVNYDDPQIKVGAWFRLFTVEETETLADSLLKENLLDYSRGRIELSHPSLNPQNLILTRTSEFSTPEPMDLIQRARTAVNFERAMVKLGHRVTYLAENIALEKLQSNEMNFIITLPIFTKQQIREFGVTGRLLPHKVTRHVMPSRPLGIDIPVQMLTDPTTSLEEANRKLGDLLSQKHIDRKPPGSVVDGRRYEEELLVFAP